MSHIILNSCPLQSPFPASAASSPTNPEQRSPIADLSPCADLQKSTLTVSNAAVCQVENEKQKPSTPSKDELESNEKTIGVEGKLGLIVFKLRWVPIPMRDIHVYCSL